MFGKLERFQMPRFVEWIDRLKLVEGAILVGAVWVGDRIYGMIGTVAAVVIALALVIPYAWWRRKGLFRSRS